MGLTTDSHLAPRLKKKYSYTSTVSLWNFVACYRVNFNLTILCTREILATLEGLCSMPLFSYLFMVISLVVFYIRTFEFMCIELDVVNA